MADTEAILKLKGAGLSYSAIAKQLGITRGTVAGELYRYKPVEPASKVLSFPGLPKPQVVTRPENENTDNDEWLRRRDMLLTNHVFVRIMHLNDLHLPYYSAKALSLWFEIAVRFQPQIVVVGSDMLDLPTISRFKPDPDIHVDDWHKSSRNYYWPVMDKLKQLLPNVVLVWVYGNHEHRALEAVKTDSSPAFGVENWITTVRAEGRVLHVGRTENVEIGKLIVAHGDKANKYAAASMGMQWPDKVVNFGHIHKHQVIGNGFSNGMLCQEKPHYDDWGKPVTQEWGTSTMSASQDKVLWTHHKFEKSGNGLITQYGSEWISAEAGLDTEQAAA